MKRLVIVADHSFVVQAIRLALRQTAGFQVVGFIDGRTHVATAIEALRPDIVLVDDMGEPDDAVARLREIDATSSGAKVLLLTLDMNREWQQRVFEAGAHAVLSKTVHPVALGTLIREIANGTVVHRFDAQREAARRSAEACPLTERELEILGLVAHGMTNSGIARQLWVTEQTVKFHLSNIYRKLGVTNRTEASRYAFVHDLSGAGPVPLAS
jgi:DNA-binding NarL/FixJ family response regulator